MVCQVGGVHAGQEEPIPEHPYPGQQWKEVRHDKTVTWLAFWKEPIAQKDFKYVWLAANSTFKSDSDLAKYEKARKLKVCLHLTLHSLLSSEHCLASTMHESCVAPQCSWPLTPSSAVWNLIAACAHVWGLGTQVCRGLGTQVCRVRADHGCRTALTNQP